MTSMSSAAVWAVTIAAGIGTLAIRFSFLALVGRERRVPPALERVLRLVPPAVLATLAIPPLVRPEESIDLTIGNLPLLAGIVAAVVAWRSRNLFITIAAGMAVLWILQALV